MKKNEKKVWVIILIIGIILILSTILIVKNYRNNENTKYEKLIESTKNAIKIVVLHSDDISCGFCEYNEKRIITDELEITDIYKILKHSKMKKDNKESTFDVNDGSYKFEVYDKDNKLLFEFTMTSVLTLNNENDSFLGEIKKEDYEALKTIAEKNNNLSGTNKKLYFDNILMYNI